MLQQQLQQQQQQLDLSNYTFDLFCQHYQIAFLDYVRFLIGAMWGAVSPESSTALAQDLNQGMHKRSADHLAHMVDKADVLLSQLKNKSTSEEQQNALASQLM